MKINWSSVSKQALYVATFLVLQGGVCCASDAAAHPEMLVSTDWLASHLNDPKVVVLQAGEDRGGYDKEHIPGARFLNDNDYTTGHQGLMVELQERSEAGEDTGRLVAWLAALLRGEALYL